MSSAAVKTPEKKLRDEQILTLKPSAFKVADFARARFDAIMPSGLAFEEALKPSFWTNIVNLLKKNQLTSESDKTGAMIDLGTEDHAYYALLYVRAVLERGLIVQCIGPCSDPKTGKACPIDLGTGMPWIGHKPLKNDHFDLRWNVGKRGFDIVRADDLQIVADGASFPTREMAVQWIERTAKAV